ncbi:hypothetical protein Tcan_18021 [Toxocara canis]|uniref:Uncharacterized protein n=1 Tax=Toxocara canis TaxID=6265 RepID=A0A0B2VJ71_TOXCA|nr:hypothetical protein Tcan_18021 [Toxocara canis]
MADSSRLDHSIKRSRGESQVLPQSPFRRAALTVTDHSTFASDPVFEWTIRNRVFIRCFSWFLFLYNIRCICFNIPLSKLFAHASCSNYPFHFTLVLNFVDLVVLALRFLQNI